MSLLEDFKKYRDVYGMNQLSTDGSQGGVTQNGALFTFEYLIVLLEDETVPHEKKLEEIERLKGVYKSLEVTPGLSRRTPHSGEGDSMDNTGSNLNFSAMYDKRGFAKRMKAHGEQVVCTGQLPGHKYFTLASFVTAFWLLPRPWLWGGFIKNKFRPKFYWNNTQPELFAVWGWFGRSPGFMAGLDLAAKGWTTPFRFLSMLIGQFIGVLFSDKGDTDAKKLPYVQWYFLTKHTGKGQRWFWKLAYKLWVKLLLRTYPNGMRDVYSIYYQDPNHPIRKYSKKHF